MRNKEEVKESSKGVNGGIIVENDKVYFEYYSFGEWIKWRIERINGE